MKLRFPLKIIKLMRKLYLKNTSTLFNMIKYDKFNSLIKSKITSINLYEINILKKFRSTDVTR